MAGYSQAESLLQAEAAQFQHQGRFPQLTEKVHWQGHHHEFTTSGHRKENLAQTWTMKLVKIIAMT